MPLANVIWRSC